MYVYVVLTPKASADMVMGVVAGDLSIENRLAVRVRALPHKGLANGALCKLIAKTFGIAKREVAIASGHKSRHKTVLLRGDSKALAAQIESKIKEKQIGATTDE